MSRTITPRLVFLALSLSIGCGLYSNLTGHSFLNILRFTALSPYASFVRIALTGGCFTTPPVLVLLTIPFSADELFDWDHPFTLLHLYAVNILIGTVQGCIGAMVWKGRVYTVVDGETIPGVLGVGSASVAGALGGAAVFHAALLFVLVRRHFFLKVEHPHGQVRPLGMEPGEAEKGQR